MKKILFTLVVIVAIGGAAYWVALSKGKAANTRERAEWEQKIADLEAALASGKMASPETQVIEKRVTQQVQKELDPKEIIAELQKIKIVSNGPQTKNSRIAIQKFENLIACGPRALPHIKEFLLLNQEVDYDSWLSPRASRDGRMSTSFVLPPSLRFGLMDVVRQIEGEEAELLLSEILGITGRGAEVAYLARVLQEMAPNKYRELAVNAARELLASPTANTPEGLDRYDREYLFGVLAFFNDSSYAGDAQAQMMRADGSIDRGALRYLQQTLGEQALSVVAQTYEDPKTNPDGKERLGRFALNFAGLNAQADNLWQKAIFDKVISVKDRNELIEDLNQDGFESTRNPTQRDLLLIRNRLALIARYRGQTDEPGITAGFDEVQRDLQRMLERSTQKQP